MKGNGYFLTGIGTDVGKTLVAATLVEAMQADYWKPIQSGDLEHTDTMKVKDLVLNKRSVFYPERHMLSAPLSPHAAAAVDGVRIRLSDFSLPATENTLIVEGAGGLMVPLNDYDTIIDLIERLRLPVILVSKHYLGSINHTLLSIEALKKRNLPIAGLIFNGDANPASEEAIEKIGRIAAWFRIPVFPEINAAVVAAYAKTIQPTLATFLFKINNAYELD
jgi:dethiobiotin synthetase